MCDDLIWPHFANASSFPMAQATGDATAGRLLLRPFGIVERSKAQPPTAVAGDVARS